MRSQAFAAVVFCVGAVLASSAVAEEIANITLEGTRLEASPEGVLTWTDETGRNLLDTLQFRQLMSEGQVVSYLEPLVPDKIAVLEGPAISLDFANPKARLLLRLKKEEADGVVPAGVRLVFEAGEGWPAGLALSASGRPLQDGFVLSGRLKRPEGARVTCVSHSALTEDERADTLLDADSDRTLRFFSHCRLNGNRFDFLVDDSECGVVYIPGLYRKGYGFTHFRSMNRMRATAPPAGWCSWYYYYLDINEEEMHRNTDWLAEHLKPYGLEYVQLDDGFQLLAGDGYQAQSWTRWNDKFPSGPKALADYIHAKGLKAGLWLTPFSQGDEALVEQHPDWFLRDEAGEVVRTFKGAMTLDPSNDEVLDAWFGPLFETLAGGAGYDYFKIDGQPEVIRAMKANESRFHRPMDGIQAYRRGLERIRETIGPARFLLSCWGTAVESAGIVNGARTGGDVGVSWQGIQPAKRATEEWYFTHNVCWFADPDTVCVRPPLTLDEARLWASLVGLTGQLLMASDRMYDLPEERVELLRRIYPVLPCNPMEFYPLSDDQLEIVDLKINNFYYRLDAVGLFNWDRKAKTLQVSLGELGLKQRLYGIYDFWNHAFLGLADSSVSLVVPSHACRVISLVALAGDRANLVATSRHITMGGLDVEKLEWNGKENVLSGYSTHLVAHEPYTLTLYLTDGVPGVAGASADPEELEEARCVGKDCIREVTLVPRESGELHWRIAFTGDAVAMADLPLKSLALEEEPRTEPSRIELRWKVEGSPPSCYGVERDGVLLGSAQEPHWIDAGLDPDKLYTYKITAKGFPGQTMPANPSLALQVRTQPAPPPPPEPDVFLSDLTPLSASQGWGQLGIDHSTEGHPLKIGEETFAKGLGTHAVSEILFEIAPEYDIFTALAGVDRETPYGSVAFEVLLDGECVFTSPVLYNGDPPYPVTVPVKGMSRMLLRVTDGGDDINYDHADWARAGFVTARGGD